MVKIFNDKSCTKLFAYNKVFLKNSPIKTSKKHQQPLMFLRAPKHFKAGKQFINYFVSQINYKHNISNIKPKPFLFLTPQQLYIIYYNYILRCNFPGSKLYKVTYKFKLHIMF